MGEGRTFRPALRSRGSVARGFHFFDGELLSALESFLDGALSPEEISGLLRLAGNAAALSDDADAAAEAGRGPSGRRGSLHSGCPPARWLAGAAGREHGLRHAMAPAAGRSVQAAVWRPHSRPSCTLVGSK